MASPNSIEIPNSEYCFISLSCFNSSIPVPHHENLTSGPNHSQGDEKAGRSLPTNHQVELCTTSHFFKQFQQVLELKMLSASRLLKAQSIRSTLLRSSIIVDHFAISNKTFTTSENHSRSALLVKETSHFPSQ